MRQSTRHAKAEALRNDPQYWRWGVSYHCNDDPRVIVRNRFFFGWAWNFGHRHVYPAILVAILLALGIPLVLATSTGSTTAGLLGFASALAALMLVAHRCASGPH